MEAADRPVLEISHGWMNAAGFAGFAPADLPALPLAPVAFVTNPISYRPRFPSAARACYSYPGGFLIHTGLPNPGFRRTLALYANRWARAELPVWVHLLAENPYEVDRMVRILEETEGVAAVEMSFPPAMGRIEINDLIQAAIGELPLAAAISLDQANPDWLEVLSGFGVSAITISAPRGLAAPPGRTAIHGRMYGPGLCPQVLQAVSCLKEFKIPIIAGCGIYDQATLDMLLDMGAAAAQLDAVLWRGWDDGSSS